MQLVINIKNYNKNYVSNIKRLLIRLNNPVDLVLVRIWINNIYFCNYYSIAIYTRQNLFGIGL